MDYDEMTVAELEDALEQTNDEIKYLEQQRWDIEKALYRERDKPIVDAKRKLERWKRVVNGSEEQK